MDEITILSNLLFNKQYHKAIDGFTHLLQTTTNTYSLGLIHCSLADAYFKIKDESSNNIELCNIHCIEALKCGHNSGYVAERLAINLEKANRIKNAIEICEIYLDKSYVCGAHRPKESFEKRLAKLKRKLSNKKVIDKSIDNFIPNIYKQLMIENSAKFKAPLLPNPLSRATFK